MPHRINEILAALRSAGCDPKRTGSGYMARCPAHEDSHPSLSVTPNSDGTAVFHCFAGCRYEAVREALRLPKASTSTVGTALRQTGRGVVGKRKNLHVSLDAAVASWAQCVRGSETARWAYHDAGGRVVFWVVRFRKESGDKDYRPFHQVANGWVMADPEGLLPPYRLPNLLGIHGRVYIVEGEKCVELLVGLGLHATTSAHGSNSPAKTDWSLLPDSTEYIIIPDRGKAGSHYATRVGALLNAAIRPAPLVRLLELSDLKNDNDDVEQWLELRRSEGLGESEIREALERLAEAAPVLDTMQARERVDEDRIAHECVAVRLSDVKSEPVHWLWEGRIPLGKLTLIAGVPGVGKSLVTADIAARISNGKGFPGCIEPRAPGEVLILSAEDDPADTIRPRIDAAGGDATKIIVLETMRDVQGRRMPVRLDRDIPALRAELGRLPECRLVIIDPITSYLGDKKYVDAGEMRGILYELALLASEFRLAVLLVTHVSKCSGVAAIHRVLGSQAFVAAVRVAWYVGEDPEEDTKRIMAVIKCNIAARPSGLRFELLSIPGLAVPALAWDMTPVELTADDLLARADSGRRSEKPGRPSKQVEAEKWLRDQLKDGPRGANVLEDHAFEADISWRTVLRAKRALRVRSFKASYAAVWLWELPSGGNEREEDGQVGQDGHTGVLATFDELGHLEGEEERGEEPL